MASSDNGDVANDEFGSADSDQEGPTVSALSADRGEHNDTVSPPVETNLSGQTTGTSEEPKSQRLETRVEKPAPESEAVAAGPSKETAPQPAKTWGWGGWGSFWSSVSTVTETAQALGHRVMVSVEDTLGLPSSEDLNAAEKEDDEVTRKLAEEAVEHDVPSPTKPVQLEPTATPTESVPSQRMEHDEQGPKEQEQEEPGTEEQEQSTLAGLTGFLSGFATAVQTTGKGLVAGGLDALELLGKKTMDVISEGDSGLLKKRTLIGVGTTPTLSQLLREAKSTSDKLAEGTQVEGKNLNYSLLFEEYQGFVHFEALELLSKECEGKVQFTLSGLPAEELATVQQTLHSIAEVFSAEELEGEEESSDSAKGLLRALDLFSDAQLPLRVDKLTKISTKWRTMLENGSKEKAGTEGSESKGDETKGDESKGDEASQDVGNAAEGCAKEAENNASKEKLVLAIYEDGLRSLAELTSSAVELFRKMAELILLPQGQEQDLLMQAKKFSRLTHLISMELESLAALHAEIIIKLDPQNGHASTTSLYLEASNSCSYVQDAFQLLCPVLKFSALQKTRSQM